MSGFFRGPPLLVHLIVLGLSLAVAVPLLADWIGSRAQALLAGLIAAVLYLLAALLWSVSPGHFRSRDRKSGGDD